MLQLTIPLVTMLQFFCHQPTSANTSPTRNHLLSPRFSMNQNNSRPRERKRAPYHGGVHFIDQHQPSHRRTRMTMAPSMDEPRSPSIVEPHRMATTTAATIHPVREPVIVIRSFAQQRAERVSNSGKCAIERQCVTSIEHSVPLIRNYSPTACVSS